MDEERLFKLKEKLLLKVGYNPDIITNELMESLEKSENLYFKDGKHIMYFGDDGETGEALSVETGEFLSADEILNLLYLEFVSGR